jgi:hypothetical protein
MRTRLAVVIPSHNEAENLPAAIACVAGQSLPIRILVSDNASTDSTAAVLAGFAGAEVSTRRTERLLQPSEHFVSCGRWAMMTGDEPYLALLAADDRWAPDFAAQAVSALDQNPQFGMVFPTFIWNNVGGQRRLPPPRLSNGSGTLRQLRAMVMGNRHELANQVYGVFRRSAFERLMTNWEAAGEAFAADFASVVGLLRTERSLPLPEAVGMRSVRSGADLIERVGVSRPEDGRLTGKGTAYVRLNTRVNTEIGRALASITGRPAWLTVTGTQALRTPQWIGEIPMQLRGHRN